MNTIEQLFSSEIIRSLGWALVHSLWQGAILVILFALLLVFMNKYSSKTRYFLSMSVLLLFLLSFLITFISVFHKQKQIKNQYEATSVIQMINPEVDRIHDDGIKQNSQTRETGPSKNTSPEYQSSLQKFMHSFSAYYNQHLPLIVTIWLLGILLLMLKLLGGLAYAQRLKKYKVSVVTGKWQERFHELKSRFGLHKKIVFLESAIAKVPQAIGYFKPVILLPASLLTGLSAEQVESILLHELAHIYRRDYLLNIIQSVIEIIFFYHPAVWWISSVIREEREKCCDDMVVEISGNKMTYVKTLVDIEEYQHIPAQVAMALSGRKGSKLFNRIKRISLSPNRYANFSEGFVAACVIFLSLFVIGFAARASVKKTGQFKAKIDTEESIMSSDSILAIQYGNGKVYDEATFNYEPEDSSKKNDPKTKPSGKKPGLVINQADSIVLLAKNFTNVDVKQENGQTSIIITTNKKVENEKVRPQPKSIPGNTGNRSSYGCLFKAVQEKNYMEVDKLLESGVNPNEPNKDGCTPLIEASRRGIYSIAKLLLDHGADTEIEYAEGWTAMLYAVKENRYDIVALLIEYGADINTASIKGWTPLMEAGDEDYAIMKTLIDKGANIHTKSYEGRTALFEAVKGNKYENVKQLLEKGAKVNEQQYDGYTCLMEAGDEQLEITIILLKYGADINLSKYDGWSPLHNAIKDGRSDLIKLLLDNGADVHTTAYKGRTPYDYARELKQFELAKMIKGYM